MEIHVIGIGIIVIELAIWAVSRWIIKKELKKIDGFHGVVKGRRKKRSKIVAKL